MHLRIAKHIFRAVQLRNILRFSRDNAQSSRQLINMPHIVLITQRDIRDVGGNKANQLQERADSALILPLDKDQLSLSFIRGEDRSSGVTRTIIANVSNKILNILSKYAVNLLSKMVCAVIRRHDYSDSRIRMRQSLSSKK